MAIDRGEQERDLELEQFEADATRLRRERDAARAQCERWMADLEQAQAENERLKEAIGIACDMLTNKSRRYLRTQKAVTALLKAALAEGDRPGVDLSGWVPGG